MICRAPGRKIKVNCIWSILHVSPIANTTFRLRASPAAMRPRRVGEEVTVKVNVPWVLTIVAAGTYSFALYRLLAALFGWVWGIPVFFRCLHLGTVGRCAAGGSGAVWTWAGLTMMALAITCVCWWTTTLDPVPGEN